MYHPSRRYVSFRIEHAQLKYQQANSQSYSSCIIAAEDISESASQKLQSQIIARGDERGFFSEQGSKGEEQEGASQKRPFHNVCRADVRLW